jgi:catechol 2,3-dioxygenase-like lactoylglutathione lyase family enzyme
MLRRIDRIVLRVPALPGAITYYRDILGLRLLRRESTVASFSLGDDSCELVLHTDPDQPSEQICYLVDDVRDLYRRRTELKLTFVQSPQQASRGYRAAIKDPFGNILLILDRSTQSAAATAVETAAPATSLFTGVEMPVAARKDVLIRLYTEIGRTADDLPYTPHFEQLHEAYAKSIGHPPPTHRETWRHLLNLRKSGKLPKLGEARSMPPEIDKDSQQQLRDLLGPDIGRRDRLPYTDRFTALIDQFNAGRKRPISPHHVWRLVARMAK